MFFFWSFTSYQTLPCLSVLKHLIVGQNIGGVRGMGLFLSRTQLAQWEVLGAYQATINSAYMKVSGAGNRCGVA